MTTNEITEIDLDERAHQLGAELVEAEAAEEAAAKRALFGEIPDEALQPYQAKVAAIKSKLDSVDATRAEIVRRQQEEERERQRGAARKAAGEIRSLLPLLAKELRATVRGIEAAGNHAQEYDRLCGEIARIAKPFSSAVFSRLGSEDRLAYQALSASGLQRWRFDEIPALDAATYARAIGARPDPTVTLEQVVRDGTRRIAEMIAEMADDD